MKNKNKNETERKQRIKKYVVSTGVYIALAAAVLGITSNSVKKILNSTDGYELPETNPQTKTIKLPALEDSGKKTQNANDTSKAENTVLPEQKEYDPSDLFVSDTPGNISSEVSDVPEIIVPENTPISGEPDDVETPMPEVTPEEDISRFESDILPDVIIHPTAGYISREFSDDELIYAPTMNDFRTHNGIDITGDIGTPVSAIADGIVEDVYDDPFMGTTVVIRHSGGLVSCYSNLSPELPQNIQVGAVVDVGMTIGGIGESAIIESADVAHVHFELYKDEMCVDPEEYLA